MNIERVSLTQEEAQWFSRYVLKMIPFMETAGQRDPKILERTTYKTLVSMRDKATFIANTPEVPVNDISLSRKQKLLMQDLIGSVQRNLSERILPEYRRRGGYDKYLEAGEKQIEFFNKLLRKLR